MSWNVRPLFLLILVPATCCAAEKRFVLAINGRSPALIVTAENPCHVVAAAAEELQLHIEQACGCKPPVRPGWSGTPTAEQPEILVGACSHTKAFGASGAAGRIPTAAGQ
jgi:hypothetical protein